MKRRRWFDVHSWLGVFAGLLLFVICWSGTVAVFSHEIDWLLDARLRVDAPARVASWDRLARGVEAVHPDAERYSLHAPRHAGFAAHAVVDTPTQAMRRVYLHPATGAYLGETSYFNVQRFFRSLHMSMFDFGSGRLWGYWFVGAFSVLLLVSAIAPLLFYRRWWRGFFSLKTGRGARVFWSDAHKLVGVWTWPFVFLVALTGLWYLVEFFDVDLGYPATPGFPEATAAPAQAPLDRLVAVAQARWPQLEITGVTPARGSYWGDVVRIEGQADAWLVRDRANHVFVDPRSSTLLHRHDIARIGWPARWVDTADPLHFGDFGGLWTQALWGLFGLGLSALCLTGAYLHVQRLRSLRHGVVWPGVGVAVAATGLVLLLTTWAGWKELRSYGPIAGGVQVLPAVPTATAAFIGAWVAVTLLVLVVWARAVLRAPRQRSGPQAGRPSP